MRLNEIEKAYHRAGYTYIAGVDEAGRGPLAGPVVAAAVIFPKNYNNEQINDSKQLNEQKRRQLRDEIEQHAIAIGVGVVDATRIDEINIYAASQEAMELALTNLNHKYDLVLSDAMPLKNQSVEVVDIVKGDAKVLSIAAASIIAKTVRDDMMIKLDHEYPNYGFRDHKGYGTKKHLAALRKYGAIKGVHRYTYAPIKNLQHQQMKLF